MHTAREFTSMEQVFYTMLRILFQYVKGDEETINLLSSSTIIFMPLVNQAGFDSIAKHYESTGELATLRKNRHIYESQRDCDRRDIGVDLTRNYGYKFGYDDEGSVGEDDVCSEYYRGPEAFSEP